VPFTVAPWNVNGIRARQEQVQTFLEERKPDVLCLQEIKAAPDQLPVWVTSIDGYVSQWHGGKGYSGVALLTRLELCTGTPCFLSPEFDFEHRILTIDLPQVTVASVYVPNGGKDYAAKLRFLNSLTELAAVHAASGRPLLLCGDLNVAHRDIDVHVKERKASAIGQRADERALFDRLLEKGLSDVQRRLQPDTPDVYSWWPPWRQMRERNIGWRIDYILASEALAARAVQCVSHREIGTSDHGPVVATFEL
jgi:exodeoxyribonuclease-3